jgi:hypothetical protein
MSSTASQIHHASKDLLVNKSPSRHDNHRGGAVGSPHENYLPAFDVVDVDPRTAGLARGNHQSHQVGAHVGFE